MQNSILNINKMVSMPFEQVHFVQDLVMIAIDIPQHITNFSRDQTSTYFQKCKYTKHNIGGYANERTKILNDCTTYKLQCAVQAKDFNRFCQLIDSER